MIFVGMVMVYTGLLSEPTAVYYLHGKYVMKLITIVTRLYNNHA